MKKGIKLLLDILFFLCPWHKLFCFTCFNPRFIKLDRAYTRN